MKERGQLIRLVRGEDGTVLVDRRGRLPGRGAYLCPSEACLETALKRGRLAHAFRGRAVLPAEGVAMVRGLISSHTAGAATARDGGNDAR